VYNAINLWVCVKDAVQGTFVGHVHIEENRSSAAYQLDAVDGYPRRVVKIIDNDYVVVVFEEGKGCKGPKVASTTGGSPLLASSKIRATNAIGCRSP